MTNHTPGPWEQSGVQIHSHNGNICQLSEPRKSKYIGHDTLDIGSADWDEGMANARLIATAPELLAACEQVVKWFEQGGKNTGFIMCREAIAKVTGESNATDLE